MSLECLTTSDYIAIIGIAVGAILAIIGIIVEIIGGRCLRIATNIKNTAKNTGAGSIQQAQSIHNGLDDITVIKLSQEVSQNEIQNATAPIVAKIREHIIENLDKYIRFEIQDDGCLYVIYGDSEDEVSE